MEGLWGGEGSKLPRPETAAALVVSQIGVVTSGTGHLDAQYRRMTNTTMLALRAQVLNVVMRQDLRTTLFIKDYFCQSG
jgi:hypothetical protein